MVVYCAYCRRGHNRGHGVCDGCGAPLPKVDEPTPQYLSSSDFLNYTPIYSTATFYMRDAGPNYHDEGINNRRMLNERNRGR